MHILRGFKQIACYQKQGPTLQYPALRMLIAKLKLWRISLVLKRPLQQQHVMQQHSSRKNSMDLAWLQEQLQALERRAICLDSAGYAHLLQICGRLKALAEGRRIHGHVATTPGLEEHAQFLQNHLVNMYGKCGSLEDARRIFDSMQRPNVVSWNAIIGGYAQNGHSKEAFHLYRQMQLDGTKPSNVTFTTVLSACGNPELLAEGASIHACIQDHNSDVLLENALVSMYGKCGSLQNAVTLFDRMPQRTVVSWNAMIAAYAQFGHHEEAFQMFHRMQLDGTKPSSVTFLGLLNACASPSALADGKLLHAMIIESGFETEDVLGTCLTNMYGKCGSLENARRMFDKADKTNVVAWNAMFTAYAQHGDSEEAVLLLKHMLLECVQPNRITFVPILNVCSTAENGKLIHQLAVESGLESDPEVEVALSSMFIKCGSLENVQRHHHSHHLNVISWTKMIATYSQNGHDKDALQLFRRMQLEGIQPNNFTFATALEACANLAALEEGRRIHSLVLNSQVQMDDFIAAALVNLYGKSGNLTDAQIFFDRWTLVLSTALIAAYSQHGYGNEALQLYHSMQLEGVEPNEVTFITILSACSHAGLVDESRVYFRSMIADHAISPSAKHYCCMVDLFGRMGRLAEAEEIINNMPFQPDSTAWLTLLGANRNHGNLKQGKHAAQQVIRLDPTYRNCKTSGTSSHLRYNQT